MFIQLDEQGNPKEWPLTDAAVLGLHKETSFPVPLSSDGYPELGIHPLSEGTTPSVNQYQKLEEVTPVIVNGQWTRQWSIVELSEEEQQAIYTSASQGIREERNRRLSYCDWTQLSDAPVSIEAWAAYRQQLRDVPSQAGFPWEVTWPTPPA